VDAHDTDIHAAIGLAQPAGVTRAATEIRVDRYGRSYADIAIGICIQHFAGKLVPHHARIEKIGLVARKNMKIRSANADAPDSHQHFPRRAVPAQAVHRA
jgi:hypothetical protein